jgi:hypothetical protein
MATTPLDPELAERVDAIGIIDTHEHLEEEGVRLMTPIDFSRLFSGQASADLISGGMPARDVGLLLSPDTEPDEKWRLLAPYWPLTRHTGFGRAIRRATHDLYDIPDLTAETYLPLTEAMRSANQPGVHEEILRRRGGIDLCMIHNLDGPGILYREHSDPRLYLQDLAIHHFLADELPLEELARQSGHEIGSVRDLLRVIDWFYSRYADRAVAVMNNCAYWRTLRFDDVKQSQAESLFDRGYVAQEGLSSSERKALQDFLFHYCIRCAMDYRLPIKIHTGYLQGNNQIDMARIRAIDLVPLFRKYPQARFVLLHMGYPYQHEVLALARNFSNVYVELSGCWTLDPEAAGRFVRQWIATAPANKLFAFGGNAGFADVAYGHARLAREGVSRALSELMEEGTLGREEAAEIASRVFRENAWIAFRLDDKRVRRP